jgi:transposase InsO family protein
MKRGLDLGRRVAWARQEIAGWKLARQACIRLLDRGVRVAAIARIGGVARQWVYKWKTRWEKAGRHESGLLDRSSRPKTIRRPRDAHAPEILTAKGKDPHYGAKKIQRVTNTGLSHATIHKVLAEWGLVKATPQRHPQRYRRFQRPRPNDLWQLDVTHMRLDDEAGTKVFQLSVIDDCSRMVLASRRFDQDVTMADAILVITTAIRQWGAPKQGLTDNGTEFHSTKSATPSLFTLALAKLGVKHIRSRPYHPRTCGKIERWHRSLKREWFAWAPWPRTHEAYDRMIESWLLHYNTERPHAALDYQTPLEVYTGAYMPLHTLRGVVNEVS